MVCEAIRTAITGAKLWSFFDLTVSNMRYSRADNSRSLQTCRKEDPNRFPYNEFEECSSRCELECPSGIVVDPGDFI